MTTGNCGCKLCGLRGYSKNVAIRSVFPTFNGRPLLLESYESYITASVDPKDSDRYLFGSRALDWSKDDTPKLSLADILIEYLGTPGATPEDLRILLCVHQWVQDEGTESV
jgi:hypothetical protein